MPLSEQQLPQQAKPKLKYKLMNYINDNTWRRSQHIIRAQPIPVIATLDLMDPASKYYYLQRAQLTGATGVLLTIGYERQ
jgi:hypothetical protein